MSCEKDNGSYRCYRLIVFSIEEAMSDTSQAVAALSGGAAVLRKGMTKQDLVAAFGVPQDVAHHSTFDGKEYLQAFYRGKYCVYAGSACYVIIENNKVKSYEHFKPVFTDDLN